MAWVHLARSTRLLVFLNIPLKGAGINLEVKVIIYFYNNKNKMYHPCIPPGMYVFFFKYVLLVYPTAPEKVDGMME